MKRILNQVWCSIIWNRPVIDIAQSSCRKNISLSIGEAAFDRQQNNKAGE
jgi:hypothetical protein